MSGQIYQGCLASTLQLKPADDVSDVTTSILVPIIPVGCRQMPAFESNSRKNLIAAGSFMLCCCDMLDHVRSNTLIASKDTQRPQKSSKASSIELFG